MKSLWGQTPGSPVPLLDTSVEKYIMYFVKTGYRIEDRR